MSELDSFGAWLERQLRRSRVSQAELAAALNMTRAGVSAWVNNRAMPRAEKLRSIEEFFGLLPGAATSLQDTEKRAVARIWYHRRAHADGGREFGNAAAFAFDADFVTLAREATQNSLDERLDPTRPVRVRYTLHELSGDQLRSFKDHLQWDDLEPHLRAAARHRQKVGRVLAEGLRELDETDSLLLLRIDDYNAAGLTGPEYDDGRFSAVVRRQLDSHKTTGRAGGSFGLGKATLWANSRLGLVLINSTLSEPHEGHHERRMIGRLDLPWRRVDGEPFAGPAWLGEPDETPGFRRVARSWWADEATTRALHVERENQEPGTSFLIVGAHDVGSEREPGRPDLAAMYTKLAEALADNFWAAMTAGESTPPLLQASVAALRNGEVLIPEQRVDPSEYFPAHVRALKAYLDGDTVDRLTEVDQVALVRVPLSVPPLRGTGDKAVEHRAVLLVTPADDADEDHSKIAYMRGSRMTVMKRRPREVPLGTDPFQAILLAGYATGEDGPEVASAEAFLRASEPPEHDKWDRTEELAVVYARGALTRPRKFRADVDAALRGVVGRREVQAKGGPSALRELLQLDTAAGARRAEGYPTVRHLEGTIDDAGAWRVRIELRIPQRNDPWLLTPVAWFDGQEGGKATIAWAELTAVENCEIDGEYLRVPPGVRSASFAGVTELSSHWVPAGWARLAVDIRRAKGARI
ncbi:helix-turn-helix transcriptional regulator [Streptomyces luomodiensis]|uniref:Helix-turn-helix transcriptional regulator n=1 Tax=Streptomyces luomodiensis TaxID=3026192 RepID=A0ABY9V2L8_9ACTN|nr:helix-turn-helix transcriptional regulator [Streptomyces sp. SCA4-21]WNE97908.1 helix-turn-helix transcriptional regulator [Streptomyces sp. SCA4-21]